MAYYPTGINTTRMAASSFLDGLMKAIVQMHLHKMGIREQEQEREAGLSQQKEMADYQSQIQAKRDEEMFKREQALGEQRFQQQSVLEGRRAATQRTMSYLKSLDEQAGKPQGQGQKQVDESEAATILRKFDYTPEKIGDSNFARMSTLLTMGMTVPQARAFLEEGGKSIVLDKRFDEEEKEKLEILSNYVEAGYITEEDYSKAKENPDDLLRYIADRQYRLKRMDITEPFEDSKAFVVREGMINKLAGIVGPKSKVVDEKTGNTTYPKMIDGDKLNAAMKKIVGEEEYIPPGDYGIDDVALELIDAGVTDDGRVQSVISEAINPGSVVIGPGGVKGVVEAIERPFEAATKTVAGVSWEYLKSLGKTAWEEQKKDTRETKEMFNRAEKKLRPYFGESRRGKAYEEAHEIWKKRHEKKK